jgi:hypothetical protein
MPNLGLLSFFPQYSSSKSKLSGLPDVGPCYPLKSRFKSTLPFMNSKAKATF